MGDSQAVKRLVASSWSATMMVGDSKRVIIDLVMEAHQHDDDADDDALSY